MTSMTLYDQIVEILPNAEMAWAGQPDPDSAIVEIDDHHIVVTHWSDDDYDVGIYVTGYYPAADDADEMLVVPHQADVVALVDRLTDPPDGVEWGAWVLRWIAVARANGGLAEMGVVE